MEYRKNNFKEKFLSASEPLKSAPEKIVSLKIREIVQDYNDYKKLLEKLVVYTHSLVKPIEGSFQGKAYLISNLEEKVIIVEHESGLEILYIAGSIASLISLIPLVLKLWKSIRRRKDDNDHYLERYESSEYRRIEIRYLNKNGELIEENEENIFSERHNFIDSNFSKDLVHKFENKLIEQTNRIDSIEEKLRDIENKLDKMISNSKKPKNKKN